MRIFRTASLLLLSLMPVAACADTFNLIGGSTTVSFTIPTLIPADFSTEIGDVTINSVSVSVNGTSSLQTVILYGQGNGGGLSIEGAGPSNSGAGLLLDQSGPALFTIGPLGPVFNVGMYTLTNSGLTDPILTQSFGLSIAATTPVAATPEPSSLAMLGMGLVGITGVMQKRRLSA